MPQMHQQATIVQEQLAREFSKFIDPSYVITDQETMRPYECDGLTAYTQMPMMVVLPDTVAQVQEVLRICARDEIPVVTRGAGTGLSGGALPHSEGVLLCLQKFNKILHIDTDNRTARVQPGVRNLAISEAVKKHGLYYAPDPSSQIACSIGGNVAENAGGVHCLKYGMTVHNILRLEMITAEGELLVLGGEGLDSAGFDLMALLTGSEGLLGVITEITVKLLPIQEKIKVVMAGFDSVERAANSVGAIIAKGIIPAGLEMMDSLAIRAAEDFANAGYPREAEALLLCEIDGTEQEVDAHIALVEEIFKQFSATTIRVSQHEGERNLLWKGRKSAFPAVGRISADYYCMDGTIPRKQIAHVLAEMHKMSQRYNLRVANVFHAGDGNLHPLILFDSAKAGEFHKAEEFGAEILELCIKVGGTITGEHGVGVEKIKQMEIQFNEQEIAQFHAVKAAFDPLEILNPGKGIPVLKRCQEYRALSSHKH